MTEGGGSGDRETDRQRNRGTHRGGYERAIESLHLLARIWHEGNREGRRQWRSEASRGTRLCEG